MSESVGRRVLILVQNLPVPFDRRVWMEATTLQRAGYRVSVVCPKMKGLNASRERLEGVDIYRYGMPFDPRTKLGFIGEYLYAFLRTFLLSVRIHLVGRGFDVIHACNPPETSWIIGRFWRLFGKRYIFDHHDLSPELYEVKFPGRRDVMYRFLRFMERATFHTSTVAIATNESHKQVAVERGGMAPERVFVVRSGPSPERFRRYPADESWRRGRSFVVAYLGEIGHQDGVDSLVRALAILRDEFGRGDVQGVFIGGGTNRDEVIRLAAELELEDHTTFTGVVSDDELCRILSSADIGVDPVPRSAWSERSTMNKLIEYQFFGLPVVAFDLTEARVSAGEAGAFAEGDTDKALAACINDLLDDPQRRSEMSEAALRHFHDDLSWDRSAPHLLAAYDDAFGR
jgi:glycosyltransferase involved in cell wall biosynthesis